MWANIIHFCHVKHLRKLPICLRSNFDKKRKVVPQSQLAGLQAIDECAWAESWRVRENPDCPLRDRVSERVSEVLERVSEMAYIATNFWASKRCETLCLCCQIWQRWNSSFSHVNFSSENPCPMVQQELWGPSQGLLAFPGIAYNLLMLSSSSCFRIFPVFPLLGSFSLLRGDQHFWSTPPQNVITDPPFISQTNTNINRDI